MPRAATTSDAFNAIAEPQRRRILTVLKGQERPVNDLARALRITPSRASKHLRVLREVGLVRVRGEQWHATSVNGTARAGTRVQVLRRTGLHLEVWAEQPEVPAADRDPGKNGRGSTWS